MEGGSTEASCKNEIDAFDSIDIEPEKTEDLNEDTSEDFAPPDGGWGWVVTISAFFINVVIIGTHNCFGILYLDLVDEFNESLSRTAWVGSIAFGCILVFAPLSGVLSNHYGCRKVSVLGIIIAGTCLFVSSFATSVNMLFFTYGFGFGFGTSLSYMQGAVMVARYFTTKRALASGIGLAGSTLGTFVMAPFYNAVRNCLGWRSAVRVVSGCVMLTLICASTYRPLRKPGSATAEERIKSSPARKFVLDLSLWKNKAFVVWSVAVGLCKLGYLVPWVHMVKLSTDIQLPREFGSQLLRYMGVSATVSRLVAGKIADSPHINRLFLSQFSAFMMGLVNILQPNMNSFGGLIAYSVSLGILDGGVEILLPVMTLDLVGAENMSMAWGCILAVISISSMGPPLAGAIRDSTGDYTGAFYFAGVPMIMSSFVLVLIPMWARKQPQIPATSILSINPSHLEIIADNAPTVFYPRFIDRIRQSLGRATGRLSRKKTAAGSRGHLIKKQTATNGQTGTSGSQPYNKRLQLPGT